MNRITLLILTISMTTLANAQTNSVSRLQKFRTDFVASMLKGDVSFMSYADNTIRLMPEFSMSVTTQANSIKYYEAFHKHFDVTSFSRTESEILDMGNYTAEWGTFMMKVALRNTGKTYDLPGKYMDIWMKDTSGNLLLVCQAWNYNQRIDFADQLKFGEVPTMNVALSAHSPVIDDISFELAGLNALMESTIIQHDAHQWKMFYDDDGNFLYSNSPLYLGRKALDGFIDEHVRGLPIFEKLDIRNDKIIDLGAYVIEYASHTAFVRGENWSGTGTGKDIRIWRRRSDCSLKIFRHIGMYD
ncbi:MAG: nuclear transport factor 2 family protein [Bacteroidota bacterium]